MMQSFEQQGEQYFEELQWKLEEEHDHAAIARFIKERNEKLANGDVTGDPKTLNIIRAAFQGVKDHLQAECDKQLRGTAAKYRRVLRGVDIDVLTGSTLTTVLSLCLIGRVGCSFQTMARSLGEVIVTELKIAQATAVNPLYMKRVHEHLADRNVQDRRHRKGVYSKAFKEIMGDEINMGFNNTDLIHIGKFGLDACYKTGLLELIRGYDARGDVVIYELSDEVREYILNSDDKSLVRNVCSSMFQKMICEPEPWTDAYSGGYLTPRRKSRFKLVSTKAMSPAKTREYLSRFSEAKQPVIFRVANYLQGTAYTAHPPTVELIRKVWAQGGGILGVPRRNGDPKPEFPMSEFDKDSATPEELQLFRIWKRKTSEWYTEQKKLRSGMFEIWNILSGTSIGGVDKHWYTVFMDKRGRWYYNANPNPQGSDIAKAVTHFHTRRKLGERGLFWLKVHIANCLGIDDIRFQLRADYVDSNWEALERAVLNPLDYADVFGTDAPMSAYAACYELYSALQLPDPTEYYTGIPVHMDATVSGTQHFSALLRDQKGGSYTNLVDVGGDKKADLYTAVAQGALESIKTDLYSSTDVEYAQVWHKLGIPRDLAKKPVMTYTYGVTLFSTQDYIYDWLDEEYPTLARELPTKAIAYLARKLFDGIESAIPATVAGMKYLQALGREVGSKQTMVWTIPNTGMVVEHAYYKSEDKRVKVNSAGVTLVTVRNHLDEVRPRSMGSALAPNFIHSLDAAHLTMVADEFRERGLNFVGIHDSFGTHPSEVDTLHEVIRSQFIELYEVDHLQNLSDTFNSQEPLPEKGNLDLEEVRNSEFFFC